MSTLTYFSSLLILSSLLTTSTTIAQAISPGIEATLSSTATNYVLQQFIPIIEVSNKIYKKIED